MVTSFLDTLGSSLLGALLAILSAWPLHPPGICLAQFPVPFRSLVQGSGKTSLATLFLPATSTLKHQSSPVFPSLEQRSPTFLAPGASFVEDSFSADGGVGGVMVQAVMRVMGSG